MIELLRTPLSLEGALLAQEWRLSCLSSLRTPYAISQEQQRAWYVQTQEHMEEERWWEFSASKERVAIGGLTGIQWENGLAEISLLVDPAYQGKGIGRQAARSILHAAFLELRLEAVVGECYECSPALEFWKRLCKEWQGQVATTLLPHRKFWDGQFWGSFYFTILQEAA